jgi:hypothetical protein
MDDAGRVGRYVYGVAPVSAGAPAPQVPGIDPAYDVELLERGSLAAITSRVRVTRLSPDGDDERLIELALRHEHVLESFLAAGLSVLPFRFGTLCSTEGDVARLLETKEPALSTALAAVDGKLEVGVRISIDRERVREAILDADDDLRDRDAQLATLGPGAAHLRRKQLERILDERVTQEASRRAATMLDELSSGASAARSAPGRDAAVVESSYLVPAATVGGFVERARSLADERGVLIDVTGPWPPYSFVEFEADGDR